MHQFTMTIDIGNAAMSTLDDLATTLEHVAVEIRNGRQPTTIRDENGNTVGRWTLTMPDTTGLDAFPS